MSDVHICGPTPTRRMRRVHRCPTCKVRRRFVMRCYEWYGPTVTCCHCGDTWNDGELQPRPRARGWREGSAKRAREDWRSFPTRADDLKAWHEWADTTLAEYKS